MSIKNKPFVLFISFLLFLLVAASLYTGFRSHTKTNMRADIIGKHTSCNLPCWNKITPGETTINEAITILSETEYIIKASISTSGTEKTGGCRWNWKLPSRRIMPNLYWENGVIQEITLGLSFPLSMDEVITNFGYPEAVGMIEGGTPENWYWVIDMFYPQKGIQVKAYTSSYHSDIEPSTEIGGIYLYSPTSIDKRINQLFLDANNNRVYLFHDSWKGYGNIKIIYGIPENR